MNFPSLEERFNVSGMLASFIIACIGGLSAIYALHMYRIGRKGVIQGWGSRNIWLFSAALCAYGVGTWIAQSVAMMSHALFIVRPGEPDVKVIIKYDSWLMFASLSASTLFGILGMKLASNDQYFDEVLQEERFTLMTEDLTTLDFAHLRAKHAIVKKLICLRLGNHIWSSLAIATGQCIMHYSSLMSRYVHGGSTIRMEWDVWAVSCQVLFVLVSVFAISLLVFRVLTFYPENAIIRYGTIILFACFSTGASYISIAAANYKLDTQTYLDEYIAGKHRADSMEYSDFEVLSPLVGLAFCAVVLSNTVTDAIVNHTDRYEINPKFYHPHHLEGHPSSTMNRSSDHNTVERPQSRRNSSSPFGRNIRISSLSSSKSINQSSKSKRSPRESFTGTPRAKTAPFRNRTILPGQNPYDTDDVVDRKSPTVPLSGFTLKPSPRQRSSETERGTSPLGRQRRSTEREPTMPGSGIWGAGRSLISAPSPTRSPYTRPASRGSGSPIQKSLSVNSLPMPQIVLK